MNDMRTSLKCPSFEKPINLDKLCQVTDFPAPPFNVGNINSIEIAIGGGGTRGAGGGVGPGDGGFQHLIPGFRLLNVVLKMIQSLPL